MSVLTMKEISLERMQEVQERLARIERFPVQGGAVRVIDSSWFKKSDTSTQPTQAVHTDNPAWNCCAS